MPIGVIDVFSCNIYTNTIGGCWAKATMDNLALSGVWQVDYMVVIL